MAIELVHVSKRFDDLVVFNDLNLSFAEGERHCLMGASGSGKTTLFNLLMGLIRPDSGELRGMGGKRVAAVFQEDRLIEHFDAMQNIRLVCDKHLSEQRIERELEQLGIEEYHKKAVSSFSGGMRRRVAIMRALLSNYEVLLMDEPFKGLDEVLKHQVIDYVRKSTAGKTVIFITHDKGEAERLQAHMLYLEPERV